MMSELRVEMLMTEAAELGGENPLPYLRVDNDAHTLIETGPDIPEEIRRQANYGRVKGCLPYRTQDQYNRSIKPRGFKAVVLENEFLRAVFLPELGGRLWSLTHLPDNRELLYVNPIFQPANLAIRNAWFSGGVEWNIGMIGHSPFTCSPLSAERLTLPNGTPVLRMREWERIRQVEWRLDVWLPSGSKFLFVNISIVNSNNVEIPMYWWSNMAVHERSGTRILAPAVEAFHFGYGTRMHRIPLPRWNESDVSYPTTIDRCADFFFNIEDGGRRWIASIDESGQGLIQTSTSLLRGRKLFVWGMSEGGRHWQDFLSKPGHPYVEIQAGLARTQAECVPMPAGCKWSWVEAYGSINVDHAIVHGDDWSAAWREVENKLESILPEQKLEQDKKIAGDILNSAPVLESINKGTGWGGLERFRQYFVPRSNANIATGCESINLGDDQKPWLTLLTTGCFPETDASSLPGAWMIQSEWKDLLEKSANDGLSNHWLAWLHIGVMRFTAGEYGGAESAWKKSQELCPSAWALRNLAILSRLQDRKEETSELLSRAYAMMPDLLPLALEYGTALLEVGKASEWIKLVKSMPENHRGYGRIKLLMARAYIVLNQFDKAEQILSGNFVLSDLREGELSLTNVWFEIHEKRIADLENIQIDETLRARVRAEYPAPKHLEFRGSSC